MFEDDGELPLKVLVGCEVGWLRHWRITHPITENYHPSSPEQLRSLHVLTGLGNEVAVELHDVVRRIIVPLDVE